jgi:hypothetical protein
MDKQKMKNWIEINKNFIPFYVLIFLTQIVNRFGELTGQYAKIEIAICAALLYLPFFLLTTKRQEINSTSKFVMGLLAIPLFIECIINISHENIGKIGYYDLSVMSLPLIFLIYFLNIKKSQEEKNILLCNIILSTGFVIVLTTLINLAINFNNIPGNVGAYITGNQNISSYILLISLPFIVHFKINNLYKVFYVITIVIVISFVYKSRLPSILAVTYSVYLVINIFNFKKNALLIVGVICIGIVSIVSLLIFNERFKYLLNYDLYLRIIPIFRVFEGINLNNLSLGVGTGNFAAFFYANQDKYSVLEVMNPGETYTYAHNFLIDRLVSGGVIVFGLYLALYGYVFYRYCFVSKKDLLLQALFHSFLIGLILSFFDIVHNSISGYSFFILILGLLLTNITENKGGFKNFTLIGILVILFIPILLFKIYENKDHHYNYNNIINSIGLSDDLYTQVKDFSEAYPHYGEIDGIQAYYLIKSGELNKESFKESFSSMNQFNKYRDARLHLSSQYYAALNIDNELINVYSDILYKNIIPKKMISPIHNRYQVVVNIIDDGSLNIKFISNPCCKLNIPTDMFKQIKYVNSGVTNLKITEESINFVVRNAHYSVDSKDLARDTLVVKEFLREINKFSEPLKF